MACNSKLHPMILWRAMSIKSNIAKNMAWLEK